MGIRGMQERANLIGGKLEIGNQPGQGTLVALVVPCGERKASQAAHGSGEATVR